MGCPRGRRRQGDTTRHFCPHTACASHGRVDVGNIRANGHPNGRRGRHLVCLGCRGSCLATVGTPLPAKPVPPDQLVWAIAALAAGLGIRAVARICESDPPTGLGWLVEAAEHLEAFSRYHWHALHGEQVPRDDLFALLSAVTEGEGTEPEASKRRTRSPPWVWVAIDPVCKLIVSIAVGERPVAMAQRLVHQVTQVLAPDGAPLVLSDGSWESLTALGTPYGHWMPPDRRQATGPKPQPRWRPKPDRLAAHGVTSYRRRRIMRVNHRVIVDAAETIASILAKRGWKMHTACIERLTLAFRQPVAAIGRRVTALCQHQAGWRQQVALFPAEHTFVLPHASLRVPLPEVEMLAERGSIKRWRQHTPAMAAGLTEHIWRVREGLMFRGPPWPQRP
jgi:hypothetical protein